jgi:predicted dehydrogenase
MKTIGVGVVGCGFVGSGAHLPAFGAMEGARLVAVADRDSKRLGKTAKKYELKSAYPDHTDLVKDPAVDLVVVAVPTPLHVPVALQAIRAGKHVLCEMPLTPSLEEADTLIDAARRAGVCLMPGLNFRFTPNYVKAKEAVRAGTLGAVSAIYYRELIPAQDLAKQWPPGSWVWKVQESGGPLYTLAVWSIDLFRWLLDSEIDSVQAVARYTPLEQFGGTLGYDAFATLKLANGVVGCLQFSGTVGESATTSCLEVMGSSTSVLQATGNDSVRLLSTDPAKTEWSVKEPGARMWGHYQQDEHFVRSLLDGRRPSIAPADGRRAMEIADQIARSA